VARKPFRSSRPIPPVQAVIDVIMKVQDMAVDLEGQLVELDLNPVIVSFDRATAVDALAVWSGKERHR
jgi:ATP-grasp domain